jgi:hypothetical protein
MSQLLKPAIVIALYALLLPVVGPLLDHHYVEWQHNHSHVYFGGALGETGFHVHIYDVSGEHGHTPVTDYSGGRSAPEGVAYFSGFAGAGIGPISSPTAPATASLTFPDPGSPPLLAASGTAELLPPSLRIAPPLRPPAV